MATLQQMQQQDEPVLATAERAAAPAARARSRLRHDGLVGRHPIDGQIARYRRSSTSLLLQYTEKHPQVQAIKQTIAQLEAEKRAGARISSSVAPPGADSGRTRRWCAASI